MHDKVSVRDNVDMRPSGVVAGVELAGSGVDTLTGSGLKINCRFTECDQNNYKHNTNHMKSN